MINYLCLSVYKEIQDKINEKNLEMNRTVERITAIAAFVEPKEKLHVVIDDPTDDKFIECAKEGNADYIVSNDQHLLKIKEFEGIKIITPEEFLKKQIQH